jgi:hypothetical protein
MSNMKVNRLPGHSLIAEGRVQIPGQPSRSGTGPATCECGDESPELASTTRRKQWHRDHKDDIRQGGTGVVGGAR